MIRKLAMFAGAAILLTLLLFSLGLSWLKNPLGLEAARLGPRGDEPLPPISPVAGAQNYLLFPSYENNSHVIHFPLPHEYVHSSNARSGFIHLYSASITLYHPEMRGKFHPDNLDLPQCNGYCGGYMRVFVRPGKTDTRLLGENEIRRIREPGASASPSHEIRDLPPEFGFDARFQVRNPVSERNSDGEKSSVREYHVMNDSEGNLAYLVRCAPFQPSPSCKVKFNHSGPVELSVDVTFGHHLLGHWREIIARVDETIASWRPRRIEIDA